MSATANPTIITDKIVVMPEMKIIIQRMPIGNVLNPSDMATKYERNASNEKPIEEESKSPRIEPHMFSDFKMLLSELPVYNSVVTLDAKTAAMSPL